MGRQNQTFTARTIGNEGIIGNCAQNIDFTYLQHVHRGVADCLHRCMPEVDSPVETVQIDRRNLSRLNVLNGGICPSSSVADWVAKLKINYLTFIYLQTISSGMQG